MGKRQRVIDALNHIQPDIIPYEVNFTIPEKEKMIKYYGDPDFEDKIGKHVIMMDYSKPHMELSDKPGYFTDQFGVIWNRSGPDKDIGIVANQVISTPDAYSFELPEIDFDDLDERISKFVSSGGDVFRVFCVGFSLFERAWTLRGMENLLMDMVTDPGFVHGLLDRICEFNIGIVNFAVKYDGIDAIYFGDDWGQQKGLIMGPHMWREFIKPRLKKMYSAAQEGGKFVFQHSCGDISEVLEDVVECGLDCYQTFQPEIYDIEKVKEEIGGRLSFWGAISTQNMLPFETPEGVKRETARIMEILGKGGGYIASPTHGMPYDVPAENVEAMIEVFQNQDRYIDWVGR